MVKEGPSDSGFRSCCMYWLRGQCKFDSEYKEVQIAQTTNDRGCSSSRSFKNLRRGVKISLESRSQSFCIQNWIKPLSGSFKVSRDCVGCHEFIWSTCNMFLQGIKRGKLGSLQVGNLHTKPMSTSWEYAKYVNGEMAKVQSNEMSKSTIK